MARNTLTATPAPSNPEQITTGGCAANESLEEIRAKFFRAWCIVGYVSEKELEADNAIAGTTLAVANDLLCEVNDWLHKCTSRRAPK